MSVTSIEWTDRTWNPTRGCSRVSEGCRNCYAERIAGRFSDKGQAFEGFADLHFSDATTGGDGRFRGKWTGRVELVQDKLEEPLSWRKPSRVFVNSMSDLFHEALHHQAIEDVFDVMRLAVQHTFQVLTKRPKRMLQVMEALPYPAPKNVWLGVSVENQETANERIPILLRTPAVIRFVSYEPALGPVDLCGIYEPEGMARDALRVMPQPREPDPERHLDWVIVGGESGPGARVFDVEWARSTVRACKEAGVAVFVKQLGSKPRLKGGPSVFTTGKGGDMSEWPTDLRVREFPSLSTERKAS